MLLYYALRELLLLLFNLVPYVECALLVYHIVPCSAATVILKLSEQQHQQQQNKIYFSGSNVRHLLSHSSDVLFGS
jgi:hypothetical protein